MGSLTASDNYHQKTVSLTSNGINDNVKITVNTVFDTIEEISDRVEKGNDTPHPLQREGYRKAGSCVWLAGLKVGTIFLEGQFGIESNVFKFASLGSTDPASKNMFKVDDLIITWL